MSIENFQIGCDPEIFLTKRGKGVSAFSLIPGSKESPSKTDGGAVQPDGFSAEFNTDPVPLRDFVTFNANIVKQLRHLRAIVPKELSLSIQPVMEFDKDYIDKQPEESKILGCDPDMNAYTLKVNEAPDAEDLNFRSGAGHIHFGWGADIPVENEEHIAICGEFVKMLDATVGLFMTCIDREPRRRELYGKAGAFRPKPYGVEYRTPSNAWIVNRDTRLIVHTLSVYAAKEATRGRDVMSILGIPPADVREIINTGDHKKAYDFVASICARCLCLRRFRQIYQKVEEGAK